MSWVGGAPLAAADVPSVLDPRGPAAAELGALWNILLVAGTVVFVLTMLVLAVAVLRRSDAPAPGTGFIAGWGIVLPAVVLLGLMVITVRTGAVVARPATEPAVTVEVIGHQFWWEIRYPDSGVVTANEITIPAGEPVRLLLRSADVIHSFWVPQLHGKMDLVPGRENTFWVTADTPGRYRGICAEFCGIQHAKMHKLVVALDRPDFDAWLQDQQAEAAEPATEQARRGREVFLQSSCVECHAVRGHTPPNDVGPDLTHLASRFTLAAGILPNNRGALGGWLLDPQSQKRGARMPPTNLSGPDLQALLDYLEALR